MTIEKFRGILFRILVLLTIAAAYRYIAWRYAASINIHALWLSIPFIIAETYGVLDMSLFLFMMWKPKRRVPPAPPEAASVDIFITTYNETPELVERTTRAALSIEWDDKKVHILDDGGRETIRAMAERLGCGYIARGPEWIGKPRHAKAGNVNNALLQTCGDFILVLDADQIPAPAILKRTLGYFDDSACAFVQTPQRFYNVPPGDPFGNDASLFYGPILKGKDGWNAAFFCGSNAVLRREALMQLGVTTYVRKVEAKMREGLRKLEKELRALAPADAARAAVKRELLELLREGRKRLREGIPVGIISDEVLAAVRKASEALSAADLADIEAALGDLAAEGDLSAGMAFAAIGAEQGELASRLADAESVGLSRGDLAQIDLTRGEEAIPVQALSTESITEDMATALRLHALGFRSVYHDEVLAEGLAPEDLATSLKQRLRWAKGTIQVFFKENPLVMPGLSIPQRLMYFATILSYFSGFFNAMLLLAPIIWFFTTIAPVAAWNLPFFTHLIPFLALNRLAFLMITKDLSVLRSEQYSLALFPLWIEAVLSVLFRKAQRFEVTPKIRQGGTHLRLVVPQMVTIALTLCGMIFAGIRIADGFGGYTLLGYLINSFWGAYNCFMLSSVVRAAMYEPPPGWTPKLPDYAADNPEPRADM